AGEVNLPRRAARLAGVLRDPAIDGVVCTEDLRKLALLAADLRERDLTGRQTPVAVGPRHADLDRAVLLVVHGAVIQDEPRLARAFTAELAERLDDEALEVGNEHVLLPADVGLLSNTPREDVVHGLLLQDPLDVAEHPAPLGELVRHLSFVGIE